MNYFIFVCFIIFLLSSSLTAQSPDITKSDRCVVKVGSSESGKDHVVEMKEVTLPFGSFCIPASLEQQTVKCIEGGCWEFSNKEMRFMVDWNVDAGRGTTERELLDYTEDLILVDNVRTRIWSYPHGGSYRFTSGANFAIEKDHRVGIGMYLYSKSIDTRQLAKNVFESVRFAPKVNRNNGN